MNPRSEFILEKMVDHFGAWEAPIAKSKIVYVKKEKSAKEVKKKNVYLVKSLVEQERREEMLLFMDELRAICNNEASTLKVANTLYIKQRQKELIYTKKIIKAASQGSSFIEAC